MSYEIRIQLETWTLLVAACLVGLHWGGLSGVAWGAVVSSLYGMLRLAWLANGCVGGSFGKLFKALRPALILNGLLFLWLWTIHLLLFKLLGNVPGAPYLITMILVGALGYAALFLFLPIPALTMEAARWKSKFKLAGSGADN